MISLTVAAPDAVPTLITTQCPDPSETQIQVKIAATALNFADLLLTQGRYQDTPDFPLVPGLEIAGTVTALGAQVTRLKVGDRIAAITGHGGLAEYAVLDANRAIVLPETINFETAAAFQIAYATAHLALIRRARLAAGEKVVILGTAGGAGLAAVEVAKAAGATVIAAARGADRLKVAQKAGADITIDSAAEDLPETLLQHAPFDIVYDAVGGADGTAAARRLAPEGRHLLIGFASGDHPTLKPNHLLVKNIDVIGFNISAYSKVNPTALTDSLTTLLTWLASGQIRPHIGHRFPLSDANEALDLLKSRKATGKIIVTP
ncbi:MAG: NADPH:quinone oxidoreductase family protein [Boseongicola sp.]|nr:NADPH:quinone oxidoreductase family protein [Boseongicola sp.]